MMARAASGWACWVLAAFLPIFVACDGAADRSSSATGAPPATATAPPPSSGPAGGAQPLLIDENSDTEAALRDALAERLGVPAADVTFVRLEQVTWPDSCLGLAPAGRVCAQAQVEGWLAVLIGPDGREYRYRGTDRYFVPE